MLYIEKTSTPERINKAVAQIKSKPEWRAAQNGDTAAIRSQFDALPKADIRIALLREQHHLCAYCMRRIRNEELHMTIEHWIPLSKDKEKALDYNNFLGVCKGGADVLVQGRRILCCDGSKGDEEQMLINPLDRRMMAQIAYHKDGMVYFMPSVGWDAETIRSIKKDINETLCLNGRRDEAGNLIADTATGLLKGRRDAFRQAKAIITRLAKRGDLTSKRLKKEITKIQKQDIFLEFAGTIIFFLNRKYKWLAAQGK